MMVDAAGLTENSVHGASTWSRPTARREPALTLLVEPAEGRRGQGAALVSIGSSLENGSSGAGSAIGWYQPTDREAVIERILIRVAINALALWAAAGIIDGISLQEGFWKVLLVAVIFGIVNAVLKPLLVVLSIPFIVVTLGIALIVINALMLLITDYFTASLTVDDFGAALLGAIVISVVSWTAGRLLPDPKKRAAKRG